MENIMKKIDERLGELERTPDEKKVKRGADKIKKAAEYIDVAIKYLADARKFPIYSKEGMVASKKEIQDLTQIKKELTARVTNLG